jgi:RHS repeat-associated protein
VATVTRVIAHPEIDPFAFTTITASYTYDAAGRVTRVDYGNGTRVVRVYDNADRVMQIQYQDAGAHAFIKLDYTFTADGLVQRIVETGLVSNYQVLYGPTVLPGGVTPQPIVAQVDFEYDNRNRLTRETRTVTGDYDADLGPSEYDLSYAYDAGGNRLTKSDGLTGRVTTYVYDIETDNAIDNNQHNNRLLGYDVTDTDPATGAPIAVEQTRYKYGPAGNVLRLVKRGDDDGNGVIDPADTMALVWWFYYDTGNHLWLAVQGTGIYDESTASFSSTAFDKAAEYRYDGGRQRYLVRQRNPNPSVPEDPNSPRWTIVGTGQWRDYMGNNIYNDYTVDASSGTVTNGIGYIPGIGFDDPALADSPAYLGSDLIGTERRVVDSSTGGQGGTGVSPVIQRTVLTAFGEPLLPSPPEGEGQGEGGTGNTRYGYAGAWGYESAEQSFDPLTDLGWLHVGERYYDPAVGRFMQRDPIGIRGGLNTYEYVRNNPLIYVDPMGLDTPAGKMIAEAAGGAAGWILSSAVCVVIGATGPFGAVVVVGSTIVGADIGGNLYDDPGPIKRAIIGWERLFKWIVGAPGPQPIYPDGPVIGPW